MLQFYSEVVFIEQLTYIMVILLDRTFVRFFDDRFRKTINASNNIKKFLEIIL